MRKRNGTTIDRFFYRKIGEILRKERLKKDYSLRYLSELTGISRVTLDNYEFGIGLHRIDDDRWKKICEALELPEKIHLKIALGLREYE